MALAFVALGDVSTRAVTGNKSSWLAHEMDTSGGGGGGGGGSTCAPPKFRVEMVDGPFSLPEKNRKEVIRDTPCLPPCCILKTKP